MYEQMDIFQFLHGVGAFQPGEYVEKGLLGERLTFEEIASRAGGLIAMDKSTQSREVYQVVRVERIVQNGGQRRLVYYDGTSQHGLVDEIYFDGGRRFPAKAYRLGRGGQT